MKSKLLAKFPKLAAFLKAASPSKLAQRLKVRKLAGRLRLAKVFKVFKVFEPAWNLLLEVPGWPDAPVWMRARRALPIVVPCLAIALVVWWNHFVRLPRFRVTQSAYQPLIDLEQEIATLRLACSDQQAAELTSRTEEASQVLIAEADLPGILRQLKKTAAEHGWDATFQAGDHSGEVIPEGALITYLPVRGKLSAKAASGQAFSGLLSFLDQLTSSPKRIDLMRLAIRADEQGRYLVELNLRLACRVAAHEKTS